MLLRRIGVILLRAKNGRGTIAQCKKTDFSIDLVLMDINMPIMNGYRATNEIKKFRLDLPIIVQKAYAVAGDSQKSLEAGCD